MKSYRSSVIISNFTTTMTKGRKELSETTSNLMKCEIQTANVSQSFLKDNGLTKKDKVFNIYFKNFYDISDGREEEASVISHGNNIKYRVIGSDVRKVDRYSKAIVVRIYD